MFGDDSRGRKRMVTDNPKALACAFALAVTKPSERDTDRIAKKGEESLFDLLCTVLPSVCQVEPGRHRHKGKISRSEFNKVLETTSGFVTERSRKLQLSKTAGFWLFSGRSWLNPQEPSDLAKLEENFQQLCNDFPVFKDCLKDHLFQTLSGVCASWSKRSKDEGRTICTSIADHAPTSSTSRWMPELSCLLSSSGDRPTNISFEPGSSHLQDEAGGVSPFETATRGHSTQPHCGDSGRNVTNASRSWPDSDPDLSWSPPRSPSPAGRGARRNRAAGGKCASYGSRPPDRSPSAALKRQTECSPGASYSNTGGSRSGGSSSDMDPQAYSQKRPTANAGELMDIALLEPGAHGFRMEARALEDFINDHSDMADQEGIINNEAGDGGGRK